MTYSSMAISMDEWMRLDAGVNNENEAEENSLPISSCS